MNRRAISKMLGVKLLPVSGKMTRTAKNMLDTEMEYIDYLRNRKKFFVMTNLMQQRVIVGGKKKDRDADGTDPKRRGTWRRRYKKPKKIRLKSWGKNSKFGKFIRNVRYRSLRMGGAPGLGKKAAYRGPFSFLNPRNIAKIGKKIKAKGIGFGKKVWSGTKFVGRKGMEAFNYAKKKTIQGADFVRKKTTGFAETIKNKADDGVNYIRRVAPAIVDGGITKLKKLWKQAPMMLENAKNVLKALRDSPLMRRLGKVIGKGTGRAVPIASLVLAANDMERYRKIGGWRGKIGLALASMDFAGDTVSGVTTPLALTGWGAAVPGIAQIVSQIGGWGLTIFELVQVLSGQDPYADLEGNTTEGIIPGLSEGGDVTRPTTALIGEGGEGELVIPHSKMGNVMSSLFKEVGAMVLGITRGFLTTLPTPNTDTQKVLSEANKLSGLFPGGNIPKIFNGKKITNKIVGRARRILARSNPIAGLIMNILNRPVQAQELTTNVINASNTSITDTANTTIQGDTTMVSNFNITDYYGSTEGRSRPHGGVDVGTPVGTPVGFSEPGEILAAGKYGDYGNLMDVWLPNTGIQMRLAHLKSFVKKSGEFLAGEVLAKTGGAKGDPGAGSSTGPHLHFEYDTVKDSTRYGGAGDPLPFAPLIKLGNFEPPSEEGTGGPSYGYPLVNTVKWPSSNGAMGGPSFSPAKASGLVPNPESNTAASKQHMVIFPYPVQHIVPFPVTRVVEKKVDRRVVRGIDSFSGKYGEI